MKTRLAVARRAGPAPHSGDRSRSRQTEARRGGLAPRLGGFETDAERARLAAEVERQRDLLQAVIEQFPGGMVVCDDTGTVTMASRQVEAITGFPIALGCTLKESVADNPSFFPSDGRRPGVDDCIVARALRGELVREEAFIERRDGTLVPLLLTAAALRDRHGRPVGSVAAFHDVSAEKARAREREQLLDEARRAVRSRDEVLAVVSHDLRNYLGVVVFAAAQIARSADAAGLAAVGPLVGQIRRAGSGMEQIMRDLLDVARIESGQLVIDRADADAVEVVREAIDLFALLVDQHGVALRATLDELAGVRLSCDRRRVVQVLSNLLGNALKFVPPGRGIEVGGYRTGREAVIFVRDEGPGLRSEDLPHVFDRYWQAEKKQAKRGIGLGLTIVKSIVEGHGGRVWVESPPGRGATFSFTLPLAAEA